MNSLYGLCPWCRRKAFGSPFQQSHPHTHTHTQLYTHQSNHVSFDPDEYFCPEKEMISNCCFCFCFSACMHARLLQSCLTLCDPMDHSPPGSSVCGILQEKYWSGLPCPPPGDFPDLGIKLESLTSPASAGGFFTTEPPGKSTYKMNHHTRSIH